MFIVEKGTAGLKVGEAVQTLGICGCPVSPVILENCSAAVFSVEMQEGYCPGHEDS
jgi:alkylation response protein AidB-like acyl-CoA dehydrogenase